MPRLRPILRFVLIAFAGFAHATLALGQWLPDASGLPTPSHDDGKLYWLDLSTGTFWSMKESQLRKDLVYVKYFRNYSSWHWVTPEDRRPMMGPSKLQGKRLSIAGKPGLDWYALEGKHLKWRKVTDRKRPQTWRWNGKEAVISETYPENWITYGGEVDPDPDPPKIIPGPPAPSCEIKIDQFVVKFGTALPVTLIGYGDVKRAVLDGIASDHAVIKIDHLAKAVGEQLLLGSVSGPGGNSTCWTKYESTASRD